MFQCCGALVKDDRMSCPSPLCVTVNFVFSYADALWPKYFGDHALIGKYSELEYSYLCHPLAAIDAS
jgi:hypothetical protein